MSKKRSLLLILLGLLALLLVTGCQSKKTAPSSPSGQPDATTEAPAETNKPVTTGGQQLLVMPDDGPDPVLDLIDNARESIRFKIYLFTFDDARNALIRAAKRGVDVRVLIDKEPVGGGESNAESYRMLESGGVTVKWAPGAFKNTHEKSLVVDDQTALIATFNFTYSSFTKNREYAVVTTLPNVVSDVAALFDADWSGEGVAISQDSPLVVSPENSRERITALIREAQQSLWLEEATLLDKDITQALVRAAKRGVDVRFILPERNDDDRAAENVARLEAAGARVVRLNDPYVHAKAIVADGQRAFVGSVNLSFTSFELNRELGIITEDEGVVGRLLKTMARDWQTAGGGDSAQATASPASEAPAGVISWQEAENYVGQEVTVEGDIVRTYDSGKVTYLNFDEDYRNTLTIVIFPSLYDQFPQKPAQYFDGHRVQVTGEVKMYEGAPEIVLTDADQIRLMDAPPASAAPEPAPALASVPDMEGVVPWQQAGDYVGQEATIGGTVVRTYNSGKAAFLNFDKDWRGKFSVVIFASDFDNFPQPPDEMYLNKAILVTGKVKEYKGAPEIIVESPEQIEIVSDGMAAAPPPTPASLATPSGPPQGVVSWQEAGNYVGQTITVEGSIVRTKDIGSITFLNFSKKRGEFVAIVRAEDYDQFPAPPAELYDGKNVWITGEISTYRGTPQMVLHSPEQVEVFD